MSRDAWFVGAVALTLAAAAFWAAFADPDWCYELPKVRWLGQRFGRRVVRIFYLALGVCLALIVVAIWWRK